MKKIVLSLMFMIISLGLFGSTITVNSAFFHGTSGIDDVDITAGELVTVVVNFNVSLNGDNVTPVVPYSETAGNLYLNVVFNDDSSSNIAIFQFLDGSEGEHTGYFTFNAPNPLTSPINYVKTQVTSQNSSPSNVYNANPGESSLPVELSSFDAVLLSTNDGVKLDWVVESETGVSGYYIYRNTLNDLESAIQIPAFIPSLNVEQQHTYSFTDYEIENNTQYFYWLKSIDLSNEFEFFGPVLVTIGSTNGDNDTPEYFYGTDLYANYPNPFNPTTTISYSVDNPQHVNISVYNVKGQLVKVLLDQQVTDAKVKHSVNWNGTDSNRNKVSSGIYFTVMKTRDDVKTNKMVLSK